MSKTLNKEALLPLKSWNSWLAGLYAAQGLGLLLLAKMRAFPVQTQYPVQDPIASELSGHTVLAAATHHLFDINLTYVVVSMFFLAALMHALCASIYRQRYEAGLKQGVNPLRWLLVAISMSLMGLAVALVSGVADVVALMLVVGLLLISGLFALVVEASQQAKHSVNCLTYGLGVVAALGAWCAIGWQLWSTAFYGAGGTAACVYWLYGSVLLFSAAFFVQLYLQSKHAGRWKDYLYVERRYALLGLVATSIVAWQIYTGVLRP